jgi:hypothetical protein
MGIIWGCMGPRKNGLVSLILDYCLDAIRIALALIHHWLVLGIHDYFLGVIRLFPGSISTTVSEYGVLTAACTRARYGL